MRFRIYQEKDISDGATGIIGAQSPTAGEWRWTLYAANNDKISDSAESYKNKKDCQHGIDLVKGATNNTPVDGV